MNVRFIPALALALVACGAPTPASGPAPDSTPPQISLLAVVPDLARAGTDLEISFHVDEPLERATLEVAGAEGRCDAELDGQVTCPFEVDAALAEGQQPVVVRAWDGAGNVGEARGWVELDFTAPAVALTEAPPPLSNLAQVTAAFSVDDPTARAECFVDARPLPTCTSPLVVSGLDDGPHTLEVRATDLAGNAGAKSAAFTLDRTAPRTAIAPVPDDGKADRTVAFLCDDPDASFGCAVDGAPPQPCTSPLQLFALADGTHSLTIRALDVAGNREDPAAQVQLVVDTTAPTASITSGPPALAGTAQASLSFGANEPACSFECSLDSAPLAACTSPHPVTVAGSGAHVFAVVAIDKYGNRSAAAEHRWQVDLELPSVSLVASPPALTRQPNATIEFTGNKPGLTFSCALDVANAAPCSSPATLTALGDGEHVFRVFASDAVGRTSGPAEARWRIDTAAPRSTINPIADTGRPDVAITFFSDDPAAVFDCALDAGALARCTSPMGFTSLRDGTHTFRVRATDLAGNVEGPAVEAGFVVDTTAPDTTIVFGPTGIATQAAATFDFRSTEDGGTFRCNLDGSGFVPCAPPTTVTITRDGVHTFEVAATDEYGNADPSPAQRSWTADAFAPTVAITSGPPAITNGTNAVLAFAANKATATFTCSLDGAFATACSSPKSYPGLGAGAHRFSVVAVDSAGRRSTAAEARWTVDVAAPNTVLTAVPAPLGNQSRARFEFTSDEPGVTYACALDSAAFAACTSPHELDVAEGAHTFRVRATDPAGNVGGAATSAFEVDLTPPAAPAIDQPDPSLVQNTTPTLTWSAAATATSYAFELSATADFGQIVQARANLTALYAVPAPLESGRYFFRVKAKDPAGNESLYSATGVIEVRSWRFLNPLPQGATVLALSCTDGRTCWFVGEAGLAMRTNDGGATLRQSSSGASGNLTGVHMFDATTGIAVGQAGAIVRTTDGGVTWFAVASGVGTDLYGLRFKGAVGYAVGDAGLVLRSADRGASWSRLPTNSTASLRDLAILDATGDTAVVVGGTGKVLRTEDGGATWSIIDSGTSAVLRSVSFADASTGYAVGAVVAGAATLRKTTDGGRTWGSVTTNSTQELYGVLAFDAQVGLTVGDSTNAIASIRTLGTQNVNAAPGPSLRALAVVPNTTVAWAVGDGGTILRAANLDRATGTATFSPVAAVAGVPVATANQEVRAAQFLSPTTGFVFGGSGFAKKTVDGGATFTALSPAVITATKHLWAASFVDASYGWIGGDGNFVARTEDGETFTAVPGLSISVRGIHFKSRTVGVVVGTSGKILRWEPASSTLVAETAYDAPGGTPLTTSWRAVRLVDAANGWIVGDGGKVVRYDAASARWLAESSGTTEHLYGIWAFDASSALAVGGSGRLLRRTAAGWAVQSSGTTATLKDIGFSDPLHGWIVGDGTILVTSDGGLSWSRQLCPTGSTLQAVSAPSGDVIYSVGSSRNVLQTTLGGR